MAILSTFPLALNPFCERGVFMKILKRLLAGGMLGLTLAGCAPLIVQSPGGALSPVNAITDGDDKHLMLFGADVVAYFTESKHRQGDPAIKSALNGVTFRFATAEHKRCSTKTRSAICRSTAATAPTASSMAYPGAAMRIHGASSTASCIPLVAKARATVSISICRATSRWPTNIGRKKCVDQTPSCNA